MGETPIRTVRIAETWDAAKAVADQRGERMATFVERALQREITHSAAEGTAVTFTLSDELHDSLQQIAEFEHRTAEATLVVAVAEYIRIHDKRAAVRAIGAEIARKHRGILDRLAQ